MKTEIHDNVFRTTVICVDSYEDRVLKGQFSNSFYNNGISFQSTIDFLMKMETMLEEMNWPQSFSSRRTFRTSEEGNKAVFSEPNIREGKLATFSLRILFRQNSSWQGTLYWHEKDQGESFRSVLELLTLLDSALWEA